MSDEKHSLIAFLALLVAICFLALVAAFLAFHERYAEALGFGGLTTGLVGVIGTFKPRTVNGTSQETTDKLIEKIPPAEEVEPGK
jgi:hypothetical protein